MPVDEQRAHVSNDNPVSRRLGNDKSPHAKPNCGGYIGVVLLIAAQIAEAKLALIKHAN
jgi:hypothetical protein